MDTEMLFSLFIFHFGGRGARAASVRVSSSTASTSCAPRLISTVPVYQSDMKRKELENSAHHSSFALFLHLSVSDYL